MVIHHGFWMRYVALLCIATVYVARLGLLVQTQYTGMWSMA
jgi:hypothetical protein